MFTEITSRSNPRYKTWKKLQTSRQARQTDGLFISEGEHMVMEALQAGFAEILLLEKEKAAQYEAFPFCPETVLMSGDLMKGLCETLSPQGIAAVCRIPKPSVSPFGQRMLLLNAVQDPGNVGTLIRTADAAGFDGVILDRASADPYNPKTLRATMGSIFHIPVEETPDMCETLSRLKTAAFSIIAGDLRGEEAFPYTGEKTAVLVGNEGKGIEEALLSLVTFRVKLPMPGRAESLNAAVAGSILMYDVLRKK